MLRYVPHKIGPTLLTKHLRQIYDEYDALTETGRMVKGALLAAGNYISPELQLRKDSLHLELLDALSDPFIAVYDPKPGKTKK